MADECKKHNIGCMYYCAGFNNQWAFNRHGKVRVHRDAIYTLNRRRHPNLIFDGSQLTAWNLPINSALKDMNIFETNAASDWQEVSGVHPYTDRKKSEIFHALELPKSFEIDLEFASTSRPFPPFGRKTPCSPPKTEGPRFVLALGKNLEQTLRLETWANELVVVQDKLFEPLETKDGELLGRSLIYGEIEVPVNSIRHIHFGNYEAESFKSIFEEWVVRPAKEPVFGGTR